MQGTEGATRQLAVKYTDARFNMVVFSDMALEGTSFKTLPMLCSSTNIMADLELFARKSCDRAILIFISDGQDD